MTRFKHLFLNLLPSVVEPNMLYVSMEYGTVVHLCACGCGRKVVTPLSPKDWKLTFDGSSLTLFPSIGNWQYPCRSHYWVRESRVEWAYDSGLPADSVRGLSSPASNPGFWRRLKPRWRSR